METTKTSRVLGKVKSGQLLRDPLPTSRQVYGLLAYKRRVQTVQLSARSLALRLSRFTIFAAHARPASPPHKAQAILPADG